MTGSEIKTTFEGIIGDTLDDVLTYILMNQVIEEIEGRQMWEWLKKLDATNTAPTANACETSKNLPSDFRETVNLYVQGFRKPFSPVPFEGRERYRDMANRYFIDLANKKFYLTGSVAGGKTIYLYYKYKTDAITSDSSPVWPTGHALIPFEMAKKWYAIDSGEKARAWDDRWTIFAESIYNGMVLENARLQAKAAQNMDSLSSEEDFTEILPKM